MENKIDFITFNFINVGALGFGLADVESTLSIVVLVTALAYNIKKLRK